MRWVGWPKMVSLCEKAGQRYGVQGAALPATVFTGGWRISEAVQSDHGGLKPEHISFQESKGMVRFLEVSIMKRYEKVQGTGYICHETGPHADRFGRWHGGIHDEDHKHFQTERRVGEEIVRSCASPLFEPLVPFIQRWWEQVPQGEYLFPFDRFKAYRLILSLDPEIWPHWFRSQRASQLGEFEKNGGYEWDRSSIKDWFKWTSEDIAAIYAKDNPEKFDRMFPRRLFGT